MGNTMELAYKLLTNKNKKYNVFDDNYANSCFITNNKKGEMLLRLVKEKYPTDYILFCDTSIEFPEMYEHILSVFELLLKIFL